MTYTVKYKLKNQWFWNTIKNVKGDLVPHDLKDVRILILDNEERFEIPLNETTFWFSNERFITIKKNMEKEVGQNINV